MNDTGRLMEWVGERAPFPDDAFERMLRRRDRKQRNQRLAAAGVSIAVFAAVVALLLSGDPFDRSRPAVTGPTVAPPAVQNGEITFSTYPGNGDGLRAVDPAGGPSHVLVACSEGCYDISSADWSPDGTRLAYFESSFEDPGVNGIYVLDVRTGETTRLTRCGSDCLYQQGIDWSPDGSRVVYADADYNIFVMDADGSNATMLPTGAVEASDPSWSPDGTRIAFSGLQGSHNHVYTMNIDGSDLTPLAEGDKHEDPRWPTWSPDGTKIAYFAGAQTSDGSGYQVWVMSEDGSGKTLLADRTLLADPCCVDFWGPTWSPDGTKIAFVADAARDGDAPWSLYVMNADGSDLTRIVEAYGRPAWRPIVPPAGG